MGAPQPPRRQGQHRTGPGGGCGGPLRARGAAVAGRSLFFCLGPWWKYVLLLACLFPQWPRKAWLRGAFAAEGLPALLAASSVDRHASEAQRNASFSAPQYFSLQREKAGPTRRAPPALPASRLEAAGPRGSPRPRPPPAGREPGGDPRSPEPPEQLLPREGQPPAGGQRLRGRLPGREIPCSAAAAGRGAAGGGQAASSPSLPRLWVVVWLGFFPLLKNVVRIKARCGSGPWRRPWDAPPWVTRGQTRAGGWRRRRSGARWGRCPPRVAERWGRFENWLAK